MVFIDGSVTGSTIAMQVARRAQSVVLIHPKDMAAAPLVALLRTVTRRLASFSFQPGDERSIDDVFERAVSRVDRPTIVVHVRAMDEIPVLTHRSSELMALLTQTSAIAQNAAAWMVSETPGRTIHLCARGAWQVGVERAAQHALSELAATYASLPTNERHHSAVLTATWPSESESRPRALRERKAKVIAQVVSAAVADTSSFPNCRR
ncbi:MULTISPECIES: hypothetical protein [Rhodanobacteraceae]|uniref:hypothetical protein n=1 Tax=Rhodanobacteraceae TaxID=1775411 RepID=UPI0009A67F00|nr:MULTISPECIES: hypothetical protein [Rhodanobacteraceae]